MRLLRRVGNKTRILPQLLELFPLVIELAETYGLTVTSLGERQNIKNREIELLITNYEVTPRQMALL